MSTSLTVQPAYRTSKIERSQANPDRTIFGTSLDNYGKCWKLLSDSKAVQEATDLYCTKLKWKNRSPTPQRMIDRAWGLRDYKQPDIAEEFTRGYIKLQDIKDCRNSKFANKSLPENETVREIATRNESRVDYFPSSFAKNRGSKSAISIRNVDNVKQTRLHSAGSVFSSRNSRASSPKRSMSEPSQGKRSVGGGNKLRVPKFRLPPGAYNFMRTASLKITETGAKDLLNSEAINKVGLGDTLQYNYQAHNRQETPKFYKGHGHVLLLGQRFTEDTTNSEETAPGGFYRLSTPDRDINERYRYVKDRSAETTMLHQNTRPRRHMNKLTAENLELEEQEIFDDIDEDEIPLNILHKYGAENVGRVLKENKKELLDALNKPTSLKHSALVPPRLDVKELNHPIDPPPTYFTNFGENLKYDKFEGGLHLYIK